MNKIYIVGIGPGNRDYLISKAERMIKQADVLIGGSRSLEAFADLTKETLPVTSNLKKINDFIRANRENKKIVILVSGDPGLYSLADYVKQDFPPDSIEILPGLSSFQLAFARLKLNWHNLKVISLHGRNNRSDLLRAVKAGEKILIFTDKHWAPDRIASYLIDEGIECKEAIVCENISYPEEKITRATLAQIRQQEFADLNIMVILNE